MILVYNIRYILISFKGVNIMNDLKSKLPDFKELTTMTGKLYNDIKKSICEIVHTYKENRAQQEAKKEQSVEEPIKTTNSEKNSVSDGEKK